MEQEKRHLKIIIPIVLAIFIIGIIGILVIINGNKEKKAEQVKEQEQSISNYNSLITNTISLMYSNEIKIEKHCDMISSVWYDSIMEKNNSKTSKYVCYRTGTYGKLVFNSFNKSISNYLADETVANDILSISEVVKTIKDNIAKLQKVPSSEYQSSYDKLVEIYGSFNSLYESIISPSGSYNDYSSKCKSNSEEFKSNYNKIIVMIPKLD